MKEIGKKIARKVITALLRAVRDILIGIVTYLISKHL